MNEASINHPHSAASTRSLVVAGALVAAPVAVAVLAQVTGAGLLTTFSTRFLGIFIEAAPFLLLGAIASGLIAAFVTPAHVARWMPRNPIAGTAAGVLMGFALPVCECGVVPVVRRLFTKGLPMSIGVSFLLAAPVMNVVVLFSTGAAFGYGAVLFGRFVLTAAIAMSVGLLFAIRARRAEVLLPQTMMPVVAGGAATQAAKGPTVISRVSNGLGLAVDEFVLMGRFLVIGCLLAAGMQTLVSQEALLAVGQGPVISVLAMQALAFLLSVCSTVDAFLALAFAGTFTTGSILAFLTFGPMVDIKSTTMFLSIFRLKTVVYLIGLPFLMTLLFGVWFNLNVAG